MAGCIYTQKEISTDISHVIDMFSYKIGTIAGKETKDKDLRHEK